jgi:predicted carbohydrate-binding protein with CBM5 and CBM33 domain
MKATTRASVLGVLILLASAVFGHGLIQDPPSRNWICGFITKPDHVQNGVAQYPVCGNAFFAPGTNQTDGYSFMSVLTHTTGREGSARATTSAASTPRVFPAAWCPGMCPSTGPRSP